MAFKSPQTLQPPPSHLHLPWLLLSPSLSPCLTAPLPCRKDKLLQFSPSFEGE